MLRRIPRADLPAWSTPSVRSLQVPEARELERDLARARAATYALGMLRREFNAHLEHVLPPFAERLGLSVEALSGWLQRELLRFAGARSLQIHLHPSDADLLESHETFLRGLSQGLRLVRDPEVTPGGSILSSERGTLDARVETKLDLLLAVLTRPAAP